MAEIGHFRRANARQLENSLTSGRDPSLGWVKEPRSAGRPGGVPHVRNLEAVMIEQFGPAAHHARLWPSLAVIGLIAAIGVVMLLMLGE